MNDIKEFLKNTISAHEKQIDHLNKIIRDLKIDLEQQEPEELKPTDWKGEDCYCINWSSGISQLEYNVSGRAAFSSFNPDNLEPLAKRQRIQSVIWNLKHALGDKHEFEQNERAFFTCFGYNEKEWISIYDLNLNSGVIYFESESNAQQVADYLNKNYPEGWK